MHRHAVFRDPLFPLCARHARAEGDFRQRTPLCHEDIPPEVAAAFRNARSKGTFFNHEIRDRYVYRDITHEYAG
ncbi:KTSC domain-containing protein [Bradyrhizobium canariense]|uniref:KTSC domain-containing protein n=1 Tax=Bradyrhizobium canariense TaxID=255045 RepID=UPI003D9B9BF5